MIRTEEEDKKEQKQKEKGEVEEEKEEKLGVVCTNRFSFFCCSMKSALNNELQVIGFGKELLVTGDVGDARDGVGDALTSKCVGVDGFCCAFGGGEGMSAVWNCKGEEEVILRGNGSCLCLESTFLRREEKELLFIIVLFVCRSQQNRSRTEEIAA